MVVLTVDFLIEVALIAGASFALFKAGSMYTIWKIQKELHLLEEEGYQEEEKSEEDILGSAEVLDVSKQDNQYYAYGANSRFVSQSKTLKGLFDNIVKHEPGKTWLIGNSDESLSKEEEHEITLILQEMFEQGNAK